MASDTREDVNANTNKTSNRKRTIKQKIINIFNFKNKIANKNGNEILRNYIHTDDKIDMKMKNEKKPEFIKQVEHCKSDCM